MRKKSWLIIFAAAALLASCSKEQLSGTDEKETSLTELITAKAVGARNIGVDSRAPINGVSLAGQTADVYTFTEPLSNQMAPATMFTDAYARGTMTFDDNNYVSYDQAGFGGLDGGSRILPQDDPVYLYGFYPKGWTRVKEAADAYEKLFCNFDGKTDLMTTYLRPADEVEVQYGTATDKARMVFKHLLTRYNVLVKAKDASAISDWGHVKSIKMKEATVKNRVELIKAGSADVTFAYKNDGTASPVAPLFYQLTGTIGEPQYGSTPFEATNYAGSKVLTLDETNFCYAMMAPLLVPDADPLTPELTLEVVTITSDGKERTTEVPLSLQQDKFDLVDGVRSTRGYSINLKLTFRSGIIQAIAVVEEWKEYGLQDVDVSGATSGIKIGALKDDGIVYWINPDDNTDYRVMSLDEATLRFSSSNSSSIIQNSLSGLENTALLKKYATDNSLSFSTTFLAANFCDAKGSGWYLPAIKELEALSAAYLNAGNKALIDAALVANGTPITSGDYYSGNTIMMAGIIVSAVDITTGASDQVRDDVAPHKVRCIRQSVSAVPKPLKVGDLKDDGLVYWINPADATDYRLMLLDQKNLGGTDGIKKEATWSLGAAGRDENDGRKNVAAMEAFSNAGTSGATGVLADDFPYAAWCQSMGAGWYFPAKNEVQAMYDAYVANQSLFDLIFNDRQCVVMDLVSTSTENSADVTQPMALSFSTGSWVYIDFWDIMNNVRCIKRSK